MAVENFSTWLCDQVAKVDTEMKRYDSKGKMMIVLLGHSMGGIVCKCIFLNIWIDEGCLSLWTFF